MDLRKELYQLGDEEYKKFQSSLCPCVEGIIGVRLPKLRDVAKKIAKEKPIDFLDTYKCELYEEKMIYGLVIGYMKTDFEERVKYLDKFIPMIDNWAVCDCCCSTYKFTNDNLDEMLKYLKKYLSTKALKNSSKERTAYQGKEFELRFVCIMLMDYYLIDKYFDKVLEIYNNIDSDRYYVQMGIAWGISVAFVKNAEKTMEFLKNNDLDDFTYNKALQKIIESNRVSKEVKDEIKKMKRRAEK